MDGDSALAELAAAEPGEKKKRRRRGGRKAPLTAGEQAEQLRELAEEAAKFSSARPPIGITTVTEEEERADKKVAGEQRGERAPEAILIGEEHTEGGEAHKRRRRRRGRGGRGRRPDETMAAQAGIPAHSVQAQAAEPDEDDEEEIAAPASGTAVISAAPEGEGGHRRRRRRRRRRGRGGAGAENGALAGTPVASAAPPAASVPDRHIFRVGADGNAESTGQTAPREPSRAIAPWNRKVSPPAVEAPPPSLRAPEEDVRPTKPARRRRTAGEPAPARRGELSAPSTPTALPAPEDAKPKRTARKKTDDAAGAAEKPKRTRKAAAPKDEEPVKKSTRVARKAPAARAASARKKKSLRAYWGEFGAPVVVELCAILSLRN